MVWFVPVIAAAAVVAVGGKLIYDKVNKPNQKSIPKPKDVIFLDGETGVGKDTILEILVNAKFKEEYIATSKPKTTHFDYNSNSIDIWNISGGEGKSNLILNNKERTKLAERKQQGASVHYVYVFNADEYFDKKQELIKRRINTAMEFASSENFDFKIIGTHRDKAQKHEAEMDSLMNEFRQNYGSECEIWDLTRAKENGEQVKNELIDFIFKG